MPVCWRTPDQEEQVDEASYRQLESQALVFTEEFNHPDRCWRNNTEGHKQSRRYPECIDDTSWLKWQRSQEGKVLCWNSCSQTRRGLLGIWRSKAELAAVTMRWWHSGSCEEGAGQKPRPQFWTSSSSMFCLEESCGLRAWKEEELKKAGHIKGSPLSSGAVHPNKQEKCQDSCMDEQDAPGKT